MLRCLSKNLIWPLLMPFAISFPTWCGLRRSIMLRRAQRFSVSAPEEAPTKRLYFSWPWRLFFSTWSARAVGTILNSCSLVSNCRANGHPVSPRIEEDIKTNVLGVSHTREAGPADIRAMREEMDQILSFSKLVEIRGPSNTALQEGRSSHCEGERGESV